MLTITVPEAEFWDEEKEEFVYKKEQVLQLEHSLVSISKWESKWEKAFLGKQRKTEQEIADYVRCMTLTQNVDPEVYSRLSSENYREIQKYIHAPMSATYLPEEESSSGQQDVVTAELIYFWMIEYNIPVEFQKWHFNRLWALIRVCSMKKSDPKKKSINQIVQRNRAINATNRARFHSNG